MNVVFTVLLLAGLTVLLFTAPDTVLSTLLSGSQNGLLFSMKLFAAYAIWLSVLNLWQKMGFDRFLADKLKSFLRKLFPKETDACYTSISLNLSANLLGMGNAATPAGIDAVGQMTQEKNRVMLLVLNATSLQILPTTLLAVRAEYGAVRDIILPTLLSTFFTTILGVLSVKIFVK